MTEIIIDPHGPGRIVCRPAGYLGGDLFATYRSATSSAGARYDRAAGGQTAAVEDLPGLISALDGAGFQARVSPSLAAAAAAAAREAEEREAAARARIQGSPAGLPEGPSLFPFQVAGATWLAGRTSAILADDQGTGKTCQTLAALPDRAPVVVVCPAVAKGVWRTEAGRWRPEFSVEILAGRKSFRWPAPGEIVVLNYDILPAAVPPDAPAGLVVVADECFPGNTEVMTPGGTAAIRDIYNSAERELYVLSYNYYTGAVEPKRVIRRIRNRRKGALVRVIHEHGSFVCTPNHNIWTEERGYVRAEKLYNETLRMVPTGIPGAKEGEGYPPVLLPEMSCPEELGRPGISEISIGEKPAPGNKGLPALWDGIRNNTREPKKVLRDAVFCYCANAESRPAGEIEAGQLPEHEKAVAGPGIREEYLSRLVNTYAAAKPHAYARSKRKDDSSPNGARIPDNTGRERERAYNPAATAIGGAGAGLDPRICYPDGIHSGNRTPASPGVQSGYSESGPAYRCGGRWALTPYTERPGAGQQEGPGPGFTRVVRVEVLEPGNTGEHGSSDDADYVYNLEVEENHNYFANGVLVSNCHRCKNPKAATTERFRALARIALANSGRVYQLSGTPLLNRPMELYTILGNGGPDLLRQSFGSWNGFVAAFRGQRVQVARRVYARESVAAFRGQRVQEARRVYAWEFAGPAEGDPTAAQALARVMLRRRKSDVLPDLPERIVQRIEVNDVDKSVYSLCDSVLAGIASRGMDLDEIITRAAGGGMPGFEDISRMRAACAAAKIPHAIALVEEYEEAGEPVVVASAHRAPVDAIGARPGWAAITGDTSAEERSRIQEEFQAGHLRGVAMTIQAGGVAITLTRASRMILVDLAWTPGINAQAEDRIHRIGQRNSCLYQHLVLQHPLEARIWSLLQEKRDLVDRTVEAAADLHRAGSDGGRSVAQALRQAAQAAQAAQSAPAPAPKARRGWSTQEELDGVGVLRGVVLRKIPATEEFAKFVRSLVVQLDSRGGLTEKQWAAVRDIGDRQYGRGRGDVVVPVTTSGWHRWVAEGVLLLSDLDPDHARTRNGAGWNQADGFVGAEYARRIQNAGGLAAREWEDAARRLARYVRTQYRPFAPGDRETGT